MSRKTKKHDSCTLWFCDEPHYGRGLCARHYQNWLRSGYPLPSQANDLRNVLEVVSVMRDIIEKFSDVEVAYDIQDGVYTCRYCGESNSTPDDIDHKDNCPILEGEIVIDSTVTTPPQDEFSYEF